MGVKSLAEGDAALSRLDLSCLPLSFLMLFGDSLEIANNFIKDLHSNKLSLFYVASLLNK